MPLEIVRIPAFSDNYIWLVHDSDSKDTMVVDPGEPTAVLAEAERRGWTISAIWNTHWHPDHTGGNQAIKDACRATVIAPAAEAAKIPTADRLVAEGDTVTLGKHVATVLETPAHTAGHITYHFADDAALFPGDTLFAMGCGRLFEGTAEQMHANLQRFAQLPPETQVYCAHEYTAVERPLRACRRARQRRHRPAAGRGRTDARPGRADRPDHDRRGTRDQSVHARALGRTIRRTSRRQGCFLNADALSCV